ncbi:MAG: antibiotic biosynthesis monooxygenase [Novosphingobium sp.]
MFVAVYGWRVHPGKEEQFRAAWRRGTELITARYGSCGSRLHQEQDGRFIGVAEWPDRATWQAAFDAKMVYDEPATRAAFVDAIADAGFEPLLLMDVTDDMLIR